MKGIGRIIVIAFCLAALYVLLNGIGWAAVFFWKSDIIAKCVLIPAAILCPAQAISVVPGSKADSLFFFLPLTAVCFILWAIVIEAIWRRWIRTPNKAPEDTARKFADP
jgi:hypothetical protein